MIIACVHVHVKPENREAFIAASLENARNTIREPGNLRFDVLHQADDPTGSCFTKFIATMPGPRPTRPRPITPAGPKR